MLLDSRLFGEPLPIYEAFAGIGIHGEIPDLECGEILEEVATLGRNDPEVAKS